MSYSIALYLDGEETHDMNWIRNPFGLCSFAEDNVGDGVLSLHHVCSDHSYADAKNLDRAKFLRVVEEYWGRLRNLEEGYFHFSFGSYLQFVREYRDEMIMERGSGYKWVGDSLAIPVAQFKGARNFSWTGEDVLANRKSRFEYLLELAKAMQNPEVEVHIEI